jgi:hypothetical protein
MFVTLAPAKKLELAGAFSLLHHQGLRYRGSCRSSRIEYTGPSLEDLGYEFDFS